MCSAGALPPANLEPWINPRWARQRPLSGGPLSGGCAPHVRGDGRGPERVGRSRGAGDRAGRRRRDRGGGGAGVLRGVPRPGRPAFVDRNFSFAGSARLHRRAVGWDLLRAPANVALSLPQVGLKLGAAVARGWARAGRPRRSTGRTCSCRPRSRASCAGGLVTDLLRQPIEDGDRVAREDALAEAILAHPRVRDLLVAAGAATAAHAERRGVPRPARGGADRIRRHAGRRRPRSPRACSRSAAARWPSIAAPVRAPAALGPAIAAEPRAWGARFDFPSGGGGRAVVRALSAPSVPALVAGATAGVMGVAALATAFRRRHWSRYPVQRALGLARSARLIRADRCARGGLRGRRRRGVRRLRSLCRAADGPQRRADRRREGLPTGMRRGAVRRARADRANSFAAI